MAGARHAPTVPTSQPRRRVAWLVWLVVVTVVLGAYAVGLRWVTLQIGSEVEASIHPLATEAPLEMPGQ